MPLFALEVKPDAVSTRFERRGGRILTIDGELKVAVIMHELCIGPFNSWDRQPFLTTVRTGKPDLIMAWREIHHNFFIDNYSPQENVDNDDGSCFYKTHDNFMVYGNRGMKNDFGGHDNHHYGNIYGYAGIALSVCSTLPGQEDVFEDNYVVLTGSSVGSVQCKAESQTKMARNQYFTPDGQ
jgi:hypothetical protein